MSAIHPASVEELQRICREASAARRAIPQVDLSLLRSVRDYHPEDMTITVEGGMLWAELAEVLGEHRQWLPVDPPNFGKLTVEEVVSRDLSGPRRCGYGTIREHLIGMESMLSDGRLIHAGGKVVKNVAGFDLHRLWVGSRRQLGLLIAATFRLRPLPECTVKLTREFANVQQMLSTAEECMSLPTEPSVLDAFGGRSMGVAPGACRLVVVFEGDRAAVEWQTEQVSGLLREEGSTAVYEERFWGLGSEGEVVKGSVLPSQLGVLVAKSGNEAWVARLSDGIVYARCPEPGFLEKGQPSPDAGHHALKQRVRLAFDPLELWRDQCR